MAPSLPPGDEVPRMEPSTVSIPFQTHPSEEVQLLGSALYSDVSSPGLARASLSGLGSQRAKALCWSALCPVSLRQPSRERSTRGPVKSHTARGSRVACLLGSKRAAVATYCGSYCRILWRRAGEWVLRDGLAASFVFISRQCWRYL